MIFVFTGNGKGKTTSAIGQGIRTAGQGKRVLMVQFIKSPKFKTGEETMIKNLAPRFSLIKGGKGFVGIMGDKLPFSVHKKAAKATLEKAKAAIFSKKYDLVILDEINVAVSLKLLKEKDVLAFLKKVPTNKDMILTGRSAPKSFIEIADLATEFKEVKHPFQKGVWGKIGREF